jgi:polyketide synthase-associated protein
MFGADNLTKALDLDPEEIDRENAVNLQALDEKLSNFMMSNVAPAAEYLGLQALEPSSTMLRLTMQMSTWERESMQPKPMSSTEGVDDFLTWLNRRHLCVIHCVQVENGSLLLSPQIEEVGFSSVVIPLVENRMIVFRNDCFSYSYQPVGDSLAIQAWLLAEASRFQVRSIARPPRLDTAKLHVMSCMERFPINCYGADMVWAMFVAGSDGLTPWPQSRWETEPYYMADRNAPQYGKSYINHGSFANDESFVSFNNKLFGFTDYEAERMSVQQRWVLETGYETLHKAGYTTESISGQPIMFTIGDSGETWRLITSTVFGPLATTYSDDEQSVTSSRLSYVLGLRGPVLHCDTGCSASMIGINAACHMMRGGTHNDTQSVSSTLSMGILAMQTVSGWIGECAMTMLSYRGRCFTFDKSADGFIRGEGCSGVNIQARNGFDDESLEQGGRLAVVYGTAANQDGKSASLTAPSGPAQGQCIRISLRQAQLEPKEVDFGELHGTGTALGDPIEVGANKNLFSAGRQPDRPHRLITAKAHLGHLEACAGVCGFVKTTLMLIHACTSPNPHLVSLNPHLDISGYPVLLGTELNDLGKEGNFGGISSFGFGGANTRGDLWAKQMKGARKDGAKALLDVSQACEWIKTVLRRQALPAITEPHLHAQW